MDEARRPCGFSTAGILNEDHIKRCDDVENPIRPSEQKKSSSGSQEESNRQKDKTVQISEVEEIIEIEEIEGSSEMNQNELNPNQSQDQLSEQQFQQPNEMPVPPVPTKEEWTEHQVTHIPFKPWCDI